jgi:prepilin-type N-terminal cleavage/methylation domain-containing protein
MNGLGDWDRFSHPADAPGRCAFTLIELLVVVAVIAILASLLLPSASRAKEVSRVTRCLSNCRQIGLGFQMYLNDHDRLPAAGRLPYWISYQIGGGDPDPKYWPARSAFRASERPLWPYCPKAETFRCSADTGMMDVVPSWPLSKNVFFEVGTSYQYNVYPWCLRTREVPADIVKGFTEKPISWVSDPTRYILVHEPSAMPLFDDGPPGTWTIWHYRRGPSVVHSAAKIKTKVVSPVLFLDGHAAAHDFTKAVKSEWPAEPTENWIWYKPR